MERAVGIQNGVISVESAPGPSPLLEVNGLSVDYRIGRSGRLPALRDVSFSLGRGAVLGVVGETGSGKTTLALTLMGLLKTAAIDGRVLHSGQVLPVENEEAMRPVRWKEIALVFQAAGTGFDPVYRTGEQVGEPLMASCGWGRQPARAKAFELWREVGLPAERFDHYPHELSGGEKRLAMLAMALVCDPELLILDEPTAGLDSFTCSEILALLRRLRESRRLSMIIITHRLSDLSGLADQTAVLYAGRLLEMGDTDRVLSAPGHPYTWGLVNAYPTMKRARDLWGIRGEPPDPMHLPLGCPFTPRCTQAAEVCSQEPPELQMHGSRLLACHLGGLQKLLEVRGLSRSFRSKNGPPLRAVQGASLSLNEGEVVALIGRTGSGKSTLAKLIVGLLEPDCGEAFLQGRPLLGLQGTALRSAQQRLQLVFQDPFDALSPRLPVLEIVREPLDINGLGNTEERNARARAALADVRLPTDSGFLGKRSHELSGGQLQRVAIARAIVMRPKVLIADEPVAILDPSEQARVLRLLKDLQNEYGMGLLLISHDLALVRKVADRIVVMDRGVVVEDGPADEVISAASHQYTKSLLAAADATPASTSQVLAGETAGHDNGDGSE